MMKGRERLRSHMVKEPIQHFLHVKLLLYFTANVIAIYRSTDKAIKHNKLAVSDMNKVVLKAFLMKIKSSFFFKYSRT